LIERLRRALLGRNRGIVVAYLAALLIFGITSAFSPGFASVSHIAVLLLGASFIGIVSLGQTFVVLGGGIDLSIPAIMTAAGILMAKFTGGDNGALVWTVPLLLLGAGAIGFCSGIAIARLNVSAIVMTLGMSGIVTGALLVYTGGSPTKAPPPFVSHLANDRIGVLRWDVVIWAVLSAAAMFTLSRTVFGRSLYAVGTSRTVAKFSGIRSERIITSTYVTSAVTAALAGILLVGYTGQAYLSMGTPFLFASVAAVAIGGMPLLGGSGHYAGTIAGAFILTLLEGLLPVLNLNVAALPIIYGLVILATVAVATGSFRRESA
jgi:ribose transport system permease protein